MVLHRNEGRSGEGELGVLVLGVLPRGTFRYEPSETRYDVKDVCPGCGPGGVRTSCGVGDEGGPCWVHGEVHDLVSGRTGRTEDPKDDGGVATGPTTSCDVRCPLSGLGPGRDPCDRSVLRHVHVSFGSRGGVRGLSPRDFIEV